ncbi:hypothetical protein FRC12_023227, partial [Ceratobasidium sp. 428]
VILKKPHLARGDKNTLLEIFYQSDVFALLARILLLRLTPVTFTEKENPGELYKKLLNQIRQFGVVLDESSDSIAQLFKKSFPDWLKAVYYFQDLCFTSSPDTPVDKHLSNCLRFWIAIEFSVFKVPPLAEATKCLYARCPYPNLISGMEFKCLCQSAKNGRCACHKLQWARHSNCDSHMRRQSNTATS